MGERAVAIERVSTRRQTPGLQSPEIAARVRERGYELARTFQLSVSARKGRQQAVLDAILDGARNGDWSVVVAVAIDRVERRGVFALRSWITDLHRAGARLESTSPGEEWLSDTRDELIWSIRLDMEADRARREADIRAERTARGHRDVDKLGKGRVRLPLGWRYEYPGGKKTKFHGEIVADPPAMAVVRELFALAAKDATLQQMSKFMGERGYPRTPETIGAILRMTCYSSGALLVPTPVTVTPAVTPELQAKAVAQVEARRTYSGPRNKHTDATDFAGRIFCHAHGSPLHRCYGPRHKDGSRVRYYRGRANGGECGCGMFNADAADDLVNTLLLHDDEPETEMTVTGDPAVRLAQIEQEMARVFRRKAAGWPGVLAELEAEQAQLRKAGTGQQRTETGRVMGDVWGGMSRQEQRRYLERQAETGNWRLLVQKDGKQLRVIWRAPGFENSAAGTNLERYSGWTSLRGADRHAQKSQVQGPRRRS
jgi:Resolvase, N terminal domain